MLHLKCKYAYKLMVYGIHASIKTLYLYDTYMCHRYIHKICLKYEVYMYMFYI